MTTEGQTYRGCPAIEPKIFHTLVLQQEVSRGLQKAIPTYRSSINNHITILTGQTTVFCASHLSLLADLDIDFAWWSNIHQEQMLVQFPPDAGICLAN